MDALTGRPGGLRTPASGRTDRDNRAGAVESSSGLWLWEENELPEVTGELIYIRSAGQRASQQPGKLQICFQSYCLFPPASPHISSPCVSSTFPQPSCLPSFHQEIPSSHSNPSTKLPGDPRSTLGLPTPSPLWEHLKPAFLHILPLTLRPGTDTEQHSGLCRTEMRS